MKNSFIWWVALVIGVVGVLMQQRVIAISNISSFWTVVVSAALFAIVGFKK